MEWDENLRSCGISFAIVSLSYEVLYLFNLVKRISNSGRLHFVFI